MNEARSVLLAITVALASILLAALGRRLPIPAAVLQVLGGLVVGLIPGAEAFRVSPDAVFFVFLPPVLWSAAFFTSFRDFKANLRPIGLLAIGLVAATTVAVAMFARHLLPGIPWAAAVALGAIVSPPDAVAAEAILKRLPIPRRAVSVLLGESLVNDASALILYRGAVAALIGAAFSPGEWVVRFFVDATVGILLGVLVGSLLIRALAYTDDPLAHTVLTLVGPYLAWISGEYLHVSAVLACVAGGIYVRQRFSTVVPPASRIQGRAVWDLLLFGLNSLIFVLLGAEFSNLLRAVSDEALLSLLRSGVLIAGLVILLRLAWVPLAAAIPRWLSPRLRARDPMPGAVPIFIIAWTGMRGIVSLAAALALPLVTASGAPTPFRAEIVLLTVVVILVTLVLQGLTLIPLFKRLPLGHENALTVEETYARAEARRAALEHLTDLSEEPWVTPAALAQVKSEVDTSAPPAGGAEAAAAAPAPGQIALRLRIEALDAQRRALIQLRDEGAISDDVLLVLESELDYAALRLGGSMPHAG
jgi:CPA1 family monovalent cation:H+ antiporter